MSKLSSIVAGAGLFVAGCLPAQGFPADASRVSPVTPKQVVWHPAIVNAMDFQYEMVTVRGMVEAGFCLYGRSKRDSLFVDKAEFPMVESASSHHILMRCRPEKDFLGFGHTHDYRFEENRPCRHSGIDLEGFLSGKLPLSVVYCGEGRINSLTRRP